MNHDDLGNYSHSYVSDLRAQLQAANERAEVLTIYEQRLDEARRERDIAEQTNAALKAEVERLKEWEAVVRSMQREIETPDDVAGWLVSIREVEECFPDDILKLGCAESPLEGIGTLTDQRDAARALNDTFAGALKFYANKENYRLSDYPDGSRPIWDDYGSRATAALSAYAKSKEARP